jgi:hypothetical protein
MAVLQSVLAVPTIAPRADTTAAKGQSAQKCWGGFGSSSYYSSCFAGGLYPSNLLLGYPGALAFGSSYLPIYSLLNYPGYGAYMGLWKKDASDPRKTPSTSVCFFSHHSIKSSAI